MVILLQFGKETLRVENTRKQKLIAFRIANFISQCIPLQRGFIIVLGRALEQQKTG